MLPVFTNGKHLLDIKGNLAMSTNEGIVVLWKNGLKVTYSTHRYSEYNDKSPQAHMLIAEYAMRNCIQSGVNQ